MKQQLMKAMKRRQTIEMLYIAQNGTVTKRRLKIYKMTGDSFQAYCFTRQAKRTFIIENVLAVVPLQSFERQVI